IQLPTDEFFNTGIYTYLWVLNRRKQAKSLGKVMLVNASDKFKSLKKSKGSKRKEVDKTSRLEIVETLTNFQDTDYAKVFKKEYFYFNKQAIMLTNVDEHGNSFEAKLKEGKKSEILAPIMLSNGERDIIEFEITSFDTAIYTSLAEAFEQDIKPFITSLDYKEQPLVITTTKAKYWFDADQETIIKEENGKRELLGCGKIVIKSGYKRANKTRPERIEITVELTPDYQKNYEIIPFHKDRAENEAAIAAFMAKYITKPFVYLENVVGVEINFNKVFYKPEKLRDVVDILAEIEAIDEELKALEAGLGL
ncbi:MAG: N-6 DNA methylase, partial [Eubacteriales bacterium]